MIQRLTPNTNDFKHVAAEIQSREFPFWSRAATYFALRDCSLSAGYVLNQFRAVLGRGVWGAAKRR